MPTITTPVTTRASVGFTFLDVAAQDARASLGKLTSAPTNLQITALRDATGNMSNAALITVSATAQDYDNVGTRVAFDEAHSLVNNKAVFIYQNSARQTRRYEVPAPDASIFGSDGKTVDRSNALVIALDAAILAIIGNTFVMSRAYLGGKTRKNRTSALPPTSVEPGVADLPPALPAEVPAP